MCETRSFWSRLCVRVRAPDRADVVISTTDERLSEEKKVDHKTIIFSMSASTSVDDAFIIACVNGSEAQAIQLMEDSSYNANYQANDKVRKFHSVITYLFDANTQENYFAQPPGECDATVLVSSSVPCVNIPRV